MFVMVRFVAIEVYQPHGRYFVGSDPMTIEVQAIYNNRSHTYERQRKLDLGR